MKVVLCFHVGTDTLKELFLFVFISYVFQAVLLCVLRVKTVNTVYIYIYNFCACVCFFGLLPWKSLFNQNHFEWVLQFCCFCVCVLFVCVPFNESRRDDFDNSGWSFPMIKSKCWGEKGLWAETVLDLFCSIQSLWKICQPLKPSVGEEPVQCAESQLGKFRIVSVLGHFGGVSPV